MPMWYSKVSNNVHSTCDPVSLMFVNEVQHSDVLQRMGGGSSSYADLPKNEHLNRLVSKVPSKSLTNTNSKFSLLIFTNDAGSADSQWPFLELSSFLQYSAASYKVCSPEKVILCWNIFSTEWTGGNLIISRRNFRRDSYWATWKLATLCHY